MTRNGRVLAPVVPADDMGEPCATTAAAGEQSALPKRHSRRRPPSMPQSDPSDSSSRGTDPGGSGRHGKMKNHLTSSVYTWACGEKAEGQEEHEELKSSDTLIGWLIILFQALAYAIIILKAGSGDEEEEQEEGGAGGSTSASGAVSSTNGSNGGTVSSSASAPDIDSRAYAFASVAAAMYLLVATATPDLRSGFALLVDGSSKRYRMFGLALLSVFGLMITAAMKLLFSDAEDDVGIITNSVTVLFIADVDEKALTFFLTVPQEWRLFWAINMVSLSLSLALIFVTYVGDGSAIAKPFRNYLGVEERDNAFDPDYVPSWFVFAVNPAAVTFLAFVVSKGLQALLDARDNGGGATRSAKGADAEGAGPARRPKPWRLVLWQGLTSAATAVRREIGFYLVLLGWLLVGAAGWYSTYVTFEHPLAWELAPTTSVTFSTFDDDFAVVGDRDGVKLTSNLLELRVASAALAVGLAMIAARWLFERRERLQQAASSPPREMPSEPEEKCLGVGLESRSPVRESVTVSVDESKTAASDEENSGRWDGDADDEAAGERGTDKDHDQADSRSDDPPPDTAPAAVVVVVVRGEEGEHSSRGCPPRSRVPALLVGWGLGYWATSVVFLLASAWPSGKWEVAPVYATILGCILVPLVFLVGVFMIADADFFGASLEPFLRPPVRLLHDSRSCVYWMMATVVRNALTIWSLYGAVLVFINEINVF